MFSDPTPIPPAHETVRRTVDVASVSQRQAPHSLEQVRGPGSPCCCPLTAERIIIGRATDADLCVDSTGVSRRHVMITRNGPEYTCEDCDSSNGVYLNGIRINSAVLRDGDVIQIGDVVFIYRDHA